MQRNDGKPKKERSDKIYFSDEQIAMIEKYAGVHLTLEEIALLMDVSEDTIQRRMKEQPELAAVLKKGRAKTALGMGMSYFRKGIKKGDTAVLIHYHKVKRGWREHDDGENLKEIKVVFERDKKPDGS